MNKIYIFFFLFYFFLFLCVKNEQNVFLWTQNPIDYSSKNFQLTSSDFRTFQNFSILTQCSFECLKNSYCLSYNFKPFQFCVLNSASHLTSPQNLHPQNGVFYYLRESFQLNKNADPCLRIPCHNNATCLSRPDGSFSCACFGEFAGRFCENLITPSWSLWSSWSACSSSCGVGVTSRSRKCIENKKMDQPSYKCRGSKTEFKECLVQECPYWDNWSSWSSCSSLSTCGHGIQNRKRICINKSPDQGCDGITNENKTCFSIDCYASITLWPIKSNLTGTFGEGILKIKYKNNNNNWMELCWDKWDMHDADAVCKQLYFYNGAYSTSKINSLSSSSSSPSSLKLDFQCTSADQNLVTCPHSDWTVVKKCDQVVFIRCVVDGRWGGWSSWSQCSVTCAKGNSIRTRKCNHPEKKNGGDNCLGADKELKTCSMPPCPVDGAWKTWSDWGKCSVSCGGGSQQRTRECLPAQNNGKECTGESKQEQECEVDPCPIDGKWDQWTSWTSCNVSCGGGIKRRNRSCDPPKFGGKECKGADQEYDVCSMNPCPVDGFWAEWSDWSGCSLSCGGGNKTRFRLCYEPLYNGSGCHGDNHQTDFCNTNPCPIDGHWNAWGDWSSCSVTCGGGKRIRMRACESPKFGGTNCPNGGGVEEEFCNDNPCKIEGQWSLWTRWLDCSVSCDQGKQRRFRKCSSGGSSCQGEAQQFKDCNSGPCPTPGTWEEWGEWGRCSATCGEEGKRKRSRKCIKTFSGSGSLPCSFGSTPSSLLSSSGDEEYKTCNAYPCIPNVLSCQEAFNKGLEENSYVSISLPSSSFSFPVYCYKENSKIYSLINSSYELGKEIKITNIQPTNDITTKMYRVIYHSNGIQVTWEMLTNVVDMATNCKQWVSWKCNNFPMNSINQSKLIYWKNPQFEKMSYWGDAQPIKNQNFITCSCNQASCAPKKCSCDDNNSNNNNKNNDWREDNGWINNKADLPITQIVISNQGTSEREGKFLVGSLICS